MISQLFIAALAASSAVASLHDPLIETVAGLSAEVKPVADIVGSAGITVLRKRGIDVDATVLAAVAPVVANNDVFRHNLEAVAALEAELGQVVDVNGGAVIGVGKRDVDLSIAADIAVKLEGILLGGQETVAAVVGKIEALLDVDLSVIVDADLSLKLEPLLNELVGTVEGLVGPILDLSSPSKLRRSASTPVKRATPTDAQIAQEVADIVNTVIAVLNRVEKLTHDLNLPIVSGLLDGVYTALNPVLGRLLAAVGQLLASVLQLVARLLGDVTGVLGGLPILGNLLGSLGSLPALLGSILRL